MALSERRLKQKKEVRSVILAAAWEMVLKEGWQPLSIRRIADAIGYSVPVIYDYFENKEAILEEFAKEGFRQLSKKIRQAKMKSADPEEQLKAIAHAYWNFASRNKEYFQLMYGVGMAGCEIEKCFAERADFRNQVMESISKIISTGNNTGADPCLKYYTFWSILHGLIAIKNMRNTRVTDEINKIVLDDAVTGFIRNLY